MGMRNLHPAEVYVVASQDLQVSSHRAIAGKQESSREWNVQYPG